MAWIKRSERIKKLTGRQQDQIIVFAEKWNRIARSTEPWDQDAADEGIRRFYKAMGCRQPKRGLWWNESFLRAWENGGYRWGRVGEVKKGTFWTFERFKREQPNFTRLRTSEWSIRCRLVRSFEPVILKLVEDFMHRNVARMAHISALVRSAKRVDGETTDESNLPYLTHRLSYGQNDAPWLAIVDYFATVHGHEHCKKLEGLVQAVASCGSVWLAPQRAIYCPRPSMAKFNDQGRLHCEDGPALKCDIWEFFYLNGVPTPKQYIKTPADELKLEDIMREENSEVRAVVLRKFGFARLLSSTHNRIISEADGNSLIGFKLRIGPHHNEYLRALRLKWQDKTGNKETLLPVPRTRTQFGEDCPDDIDDCEQVRRWTLGWPKEAIAVAET